MKRFGHTFGIGLCAAVVVAGVLAVSTPVARGQDGGAAAEERAQEFETLLKRVRSSASEASEAEVLRFLEISRQTGRDYAAAVAVKSYLARHYDASPRVTLAAAHAARRGGDLAAAISRYKNYLAQSPANRTAAEVAAQLYRTQLQSRKERDAFVTMKQFGEKFRNHPEARRYDRWFLGEARRRGDYGAFAKRLATILSEKLPLEAERVAVWDEIDRLTRDLTRAEESMYPAVEPARSIAQSLRGDRRRAQRLAFVAEHLDYSADYATKDQAARERDFRGVARAAMAYLKAEPTAETLKDIVITLGGGHHSRPHINTFRGHWRRSQEQHQALFVDAFSALKNDQERAAVVDWEAFGVHLAPELASTSQWVTLGEKHPKAIQRAQGGHRLPIQFEADNAATWKTQAGYLNQARGADVAALRSLAAGNGDLTTTLRHLFSKENWHIKGGAFANAIDQRIVPSLAHLARQNEQQLGEHALDDALAELGPKHIASTPLAIVNRDLAERYLRAAWSRGGEEYDRAAVIEHLKNLDWIAWDKQQRASVVEPAYRDFRDWAERVRRETGELEKTIADWQKRVEREQAGAEKLKERAASLKGDAEKQEQFQKARSQFVEAEKALKESQEKLAAFKAQAEAVAGAVEQIGTIDEAFKRSLDPSVARKAKAPDALSAACSDLVAAINAKDQAAYEKAVRAVYKQVRQFDEKKTPFGAAALRMAMWNREGVESLALQMEMLVDQLERWKPGFDDRVIARVMDTIAESHGNRVRPGSTYRSHQKIAVEISNALAKVLSDQIDNGMFYDRAFSWLRSYRYGRGWHGWRGSDQNKQLMVKMVEEQVFRKLTDYRVSSAFAAPTYQWLIANRWDDLRNDYDVDRYFDDMFVAEGEEKGWLDPNYFRYGNDRDRKAADLAAGMFAGYKKLPLPYGEDAGGGWSHDAVMRWQSHALNAKPGPRAKMLAQLESTWGKGRFDAYAMGAGWFETVNEIGGENGVAQDEFFKRLRTYLDRSSQYPLLAASPNVGALGRLDTASLNDEGLETLLTLVERTTPAQWTRGNGFVRVAQLLREGLYERGRETDLIGLAPTLWRISLEEHRDSFKRTLLSWSQDLLEREKYDLAVVFANVGMDVLGTQVDSQFDSALRTVQARANANVSGVIPVERDDPRYGIFAAQASFLSGKTESAWDGYKQNRNMLMRYYQQFDPTFLLWIVRRSTELGEFDQAEQLAREMQIWFDQRAAAVDPELQAQLGLAYARIAYARKEYPRARAFYDRVAKASAYENTRAQKHAKVMVAEVDRVTGRYDEAFRALETIVRESEEPEIRAEALYYMALVKFDQEEFSEAGDMVKQIFVEVPDHPLARILEARINLKLQKLEEPTEIDIGTVTQRQFIVPGKVLKVAMEDPNLSVVGQATLVELRAWTESGDEERFSLTPFGDSKTRFRGELPTELAPRQKGDGRLQVLGEDTVYYDFADSFRKSHNVQLAQPKALQVVSEARLLASTGELLSEAEKRERELEEEIRRSIEGRRANDRGLTRERDHDIVKPGNQINVQVIDADQSRTAAVDRLPIKVTSSSGDVISELLLEETDTHSGVFEGAIQTAEGAAIAYASDSADGRDPNFAISAGDYPAWEALHDARRPKWFSVDLNDRIRAGAMRLSASEPGRKLKRFALEVSPDGKNYQIVGQYPGEFTPWDGSPRVDYVELPDESMVTEPTELRDYVRSGYMARGKKQSRPIEDLAVDWDTNDIRNMNISLGWNLYHFRAAFYQNERRVRHFEVEVGSENTRVFMFFDNELVINSQRGTEFRESVDRGVHKIDIYVASLRETKFRLMTDAAEPPFLKPMPAAEIDPEQNPEIRERIKREPAKIEANEQGTQFDIQFPAETTLRVFRLNILDYETDAPAINRIVFNNVDGKQILPTEQDFMDLRKNETLEIVPGDTVAINYLDPRGIESNDRLHEAFLEAAYTDAEVEAAFVEVSGRGGARETELIELRRFETGDTVSLVVNDPDMDVSPELDSVEFTIRTDSGHTVTLEALETEPYSGRFIGRFFPISGEPTRESEIPVEPAEGLQVIYLDEHNTDPGVPWERIVNLEQVTWVTPELRVYDYQASPLSPEAIEAAMENPDEQRDGLTAEFVPPRYDLLVSRPLEAGGEPASVGSMAYPLAVEVVWPTVAKSPESTTTIYVQTSTGRQLHGGGDAEGRDAQGGGAAGPNGGAGPDGGAGPNAAMGPNRKPGPQFQPGPGPDGDGEGEGEPGPQSPPFDITVPGTIKMAVEPDDAPGLRPEPGYQSVVVRGDMYATDPVSDGRFTFLVPLELGMPEERSLAVEREYEPNQRDDDELTLKVNGNDTVHIGFKFTGPNGDERWITRDVELAAAPILDVMDRRYQEPVKSIQVGQKLYFRVIDPKRNVSDDKDEFNLAVEPESGDERTIRLSETFSHSGVFKGLVEVRHRDELAQADSAEADEQDGEAAAEEMNGQDGQTQAQTAGLTMAVPVVYGDNLSVRYDPSRDDASSQAWDIFIRRGDTGDVLPFTKRFADPEIAVQTQFTMAESFFELAKRHRELENEDLARVKVLQGKKLLEEALADFTETAMRAQAEYLLANLAMEFGDDANNDQTKKRFYNEAVTRFSDLVATYPDSEYAPKAQYKKALVYEKMSEYQPTLMDRASEEYVKLSYRYPEHELVADTIVRLGNYFRSKGRTMRDEAAALDERGQPVEAEKIRRQARKMFITAAQVLSRLSERFPQHNLAAKTLVISGQCAMQGENYELATGTFQRVIEDTETENELRAMAMFWNGRAYMEMRNLESAYVNLKKLTWDYPASDWARYARGLLATNEALIKMEKEK